MLKLIFPEHIVPLISKPVFAGWKGIALAPCHWRTVCAFRINGIMVGPHGRAGLPNIITHSMAHAVRRVCGKSLKTKRLLIPYFIFTGILCSDRLYLPKTIKFCRITIDRGELSEAKFCFVQSGNAISAQRGGRFL